MLLISLLSAMVMCVFYTCIFGLSVCKQIRFFVKSALKNMSHYLALSISLYFSLSRSQYKWKYPHTIISIQDLKPARELSIRPSAPVFSLNKLNIEHYWSVRCLYSILLHFALSYQCAQYSNNLFQNFHSVALD